MVSNQQHLPFRAGISCRVSVPLFKENKSTMQVKINGCWKTQVSPTEDNLVAGAIFHILQKFPNLKPQHQASLVSIYFFSLVFQIKDKTMAMRTCQSEYQDIPLNRMVVSIQKENFLNNSFLTISVITGLLLQLSKYVED